MTPLLPYGERQKNAPRGSAARQVWEDHTLTLGRRERAAWQERSSPQILTPSLHVIGLSADVTFCRAPGCRAPGQARCSPAAGGIAVRAWGCGGRQNRARTACVPARTRAVAPHLECQACGQPCCGLTGQSLRLAGIAFSHKVASKGRKTHRACPGDPSVGAVADGWVRPLYEFLNRSLCEKNNGLVDRARICRKDRMQITSG